MEWYGIFYFMLFIIYGLFNFKTLLWEAMCILSREHDNIGIRALLISFEAITLDVVNICHEDVLSGTFGARLCDKRTSVFIVITCNCISHTCNFKLITQPYTNS